MQHFQANTSYNTVKCQIKYEEGDGSDGAWILQVKGKSYLLHSHPTESMSKTGENCKTLCQESIPKHIQLYKCSMSGICTDNAKNMEWICNASQQNDPNPIVCGWSAHWLNVLSSLSGHLRGLVVACWTRDHYHPCLNPGGGGYLKVVSCIMCTSYWPEICLEKPNFGV